MNPLIQNATSRLFTAAALIGLLSVASAQDSPKHIRTTPPEPAISLAAKDWVALRAWFHQPQFNVSDGLDSYADEGHRSSTAAKSAAGLTSRRASIASAQGSPEPIPTTPFGSIPEPAISLAAKDWVALRAWFHQPQFNVSDGLDSYADEGHRSISTQQIAVISPLRTQ